VSTTAQRLKRESVRRRHRTRNACSWISVDNSVRLVVSSGSLVRSDVSSVLLCVRASGGAFALATLVEALLVAAGVLARVRQTVDAAYFRRRLHTTYSHRCKSHLFQHLFIQRRLISALCY